MTSNKKVDVKTLVVIAMLSAISCVLMLMIRVSIMPGNEFLIFDLKDMAIVIGGFLYGPSAVCVMSVIVSFVEMNTVSADTWVGFAMNVISTCAFACPAAFIYKRKRSLKGAVAGLAAGWLLVSGVMVMWNYIITPGYRGFPRELIVPLLPTVFLPFNLIKYGFSAALTMLVYKPLSIALRKARMVQQTEKKATARENIVAGVALSLCLAVVPCVLLILVRQGIIS